MNSAISESSLVHDRHPLPSGLNPPEAQRRTAERLKGAWHELDTGHYPMLSQPDELTRLLLAT